MYSELYELWPQLSYCEAHWKIDKVFVATYPQWYKRHLEKHPGAAVIKAEIPPKTDQVELKKQSNKRAREEHPQKAEKAHGLRCSCKW